MPVALSRGIETQSLRLCHNYSQEPDRSTSRCRDHIPPNQMFSETPALSDKPSAAGEALFFA